MTAATHENPTLTLTPSNWNFTASKQELINSLSIMERIIPSRSSNPLLTHLKLTSENGVLLAQGTNLEIDLQVVIPCKLTGDVDTSVPAHLFVQLIRSMGGSLITVEGYSDKVILQASGSTMEIQTGDSAAYPEITFIESESTNIMADQLSTSLRRVKHAASNEAFQAVFRGILTEWNENEIIAVSSDGFRIASYTIAQSGNKMGNKIIPARSAEEVSRWLELREKEKVTVSFGEGIATFKANQNAITVKLLDGDFPDWRRVIPSETQFKIVINAETLRSAVSAISILADKNANNRIVLTVEENRLILRSDGDYGHGQHVLSAETSSSENFGLNIAFNAKYLLEAISTIENNVTLQGTNSINPLKITDDNQFLAVVVPLRA